VFERFVRIRPQISRDLEQLKPRRTDYFGQWQADHAPVPGNVCPSSLLRSLRADGRVFAHERYRSTGKPWAIGAERRWRRPKPGRQRLGVASIGSSGMAEPYRGRNTSDSARMPEIIGAQIIASRLVMR